MTGKEIYSALAVCGYFKIEKKIYRNRSWLHAGNDVIGFEASIAVNWNKELVLNKIKYWCDDRKLPVVIENISNHPTKFKIKIIK